MKIENSVPIVSIKSLVCLTSAADNPGVQETSNLLLNAAKEWGFVLIKNHGVPHALLEEMEKLSREFFEMPLSKKMKIKMSLGGKAWRGYFPPGSELTSGISDAKEGIYFGTELNVNDPKVKQGTPLHGPNLWPHDDVPELRPIILEYLSHLTELGHVLLRGFAIGLNLDQNYFKTFFGTDPIILFRIFNYPQSDQKEGWGVGEHTDYGYLTILKTDHNPGLQVLSPQQQEWINVPVMKDTLIVNIGDQLEIATKGLLKATPHRVFLQRNGNRLSWPFFFDPGWECKLKTISLEESTVLKEWIESGGSLTRKPGKRWDGKNLLEQCPSMTYGEYLQDKVSKCFPLLFNKVI